MLLDEKYFGAFQKVSEKIYIGDYGVLEDSEALENESLFNIVNLSQMNSESDKLKLAGWTILDIDQDDGYPIRSGNLDVFLDFMREKEHENILIVCGAGISRSASFIIAYFMYHGLTWDEAEEMIRNARPIIQPHFELKRSVLEYFGVKYTPIGYEELE